MRLRLAVSLLLALGLLAQPAAAQAPPGPDADNVGPGNPYGWFEADKPWRGDFGDPQIVLVGDTYYAYGSPTGGRYLPVMTSTDLVTWVAHPRWSTSPAPYAGGPDPSTDPSIPVEIRQSGLSAGDIWNHNEALVAPPPWALRRPQSTWIQYDFWAPGVIQIGQTWFLYVAAKVSNESDDPNGYGRFCITMATAPSPLGPFRDASGGGPVICDVDPAGSIDPEPFRDPVTGEVHLVWKAAGRRTQPGVQGYPTSLRSIRLGPDGRPAAGASPTVLLTTNEGSWEGMTIENPSMVHFGGRYYLFYSGNTWFARPDGSSDYATGYALCPDGPRAPCQRFANNPLLASNGPMQGPASGGAFVDRNGALRLAYAAYTLGERRPDAGIQHPRRLGVVQLVPRGDGSLEVGSAPSVAARSIDRACPGAATGSRFADVPAAMGAARAIECVADWGVAVGTGGRSYSPEGIVTRRQLATFLVRLIEATGGDLPDAGAAGDRFTDDDGDVHEANIDRLAAAGLVAGVGGDRFAPLQPVTRGQMATFVRRTLEHVLGRPLPAGPDVFVDDRGSVHEAATNAVAAAGIATGTVPGGFSPNASTSRAQMAAFLARTLDVVVEAGQATPPR